MSWHRPVAGDAPARCGLVSRPDAVLVRPLPSGTGSARVFPSLRLPQGPIRMRLDTGRPLADRVDPADPVPNGLLRLTPARDRPSQQTNQKTEDQFHGVRLADDHGLPLQEVALT